MRPYFEKGSLKMKSLLTAVILGSALVTACVTAPSPGAQEGNPPPRLVMQDKLKVWDNVGNFGPVPAAQAKLGADTCASFNTADAQYMATGYHSRAQGLDGKTLPGGGFYCVHK
jgi:hypothetical protein